jgi:flagella basal body P-ring formation protein FlgA
MRNLPVSLLLKRLSMLSAALLATQAHAQGQAIEAVAAIRAVASSYVAAQVPVGAQIHVANLDERLRMPDCEQPLRATPATRPVNGQWNIAVSCAAPRAWTLYVPVRVSQSGTVIVLKHNMRAGEAITADALSVQTRETATLAYGYISDPAQAIGKVMRRPLGAGSPVTPDAIGAPFSVRRGQSVSLICSAGAIEVRSEGRALGDGGTGDRVKVENANSKRVVEGTVQEDGSVRITL